MHVHRGRRRELVAGEAGEAAGQGLQGLGGAGAVVVLAGADLPGGCVGEGVGHPPSHAISCVVSDAAGNTSSHAQSRLPHSVP